MLKQTPVFVACGFLLTAVKTPSAKGQESANPAAVAAMKDAAQKGFSLSNVSSTDVTGNVSVEAALIPASVAKTVFGKKVSTVTP